MGIKAVGTMPMAGAALAGIDGSAEPALDHRGARSSHVPGSPMVSAQRLKDALSLVERKAGLIVDGLYRLDAVLQLGAAWGDGAVHGEGKACCDARARAEVQEIMRTAKDLLACAAGETLRQRQSPAEHAGAAANRESRDPTAVPRPRWEERLTCEQATSLEWQEHCNGNGPSKIPDFANSGRLSQSSTATSEPGSEWERRVMLEELPRGQPIWCPVLDDPGRQPLGMQGQDESTMLEELGPSEGRACGSPGGTSDTLPAQVSIHTSPSDLPVLPAPATRFAASVARFAPSPPTLSRLDHLPPISAEMARLLAPALFRPGGGGGGDGDGGGSAPKGEERGRRALGHAMEVAGQGVTREATGDEEEDVSVQEQYVDIALTIDLDLRERVRLATSDRARSGSQGESPGIAFLEGLRRNLSLATSLHT